MRSVSLLTVTCALALVLPATAGAAGLSEYRGFTLGDPLQAVIDRLQLAASDVKVVRERPTVQEVTWRPTQFVSGRTGETDSLAEMVLTFDEGRLARISVMYDRARTQGLTDEDLHDAIASVYGVSLLMPVPPQRSIGPPAARQAIGRWEDAKTFVLLWREDYPTRVGLAITSIASERVLQEAVEEGLPLHAIQGAATDRVSGTAEAAALQARDEKTRQDNKATFKP